MVKYELVGGGRWVVTCGTVCFIASSLRVVFVLTSSSPFSPHTRLGISPRACLVCLMWWFTIRPFAFFILPHPTATAPAPAPRPSSPPSSPQKRQ
jgi:hypothetical protein